MASLEIFILLHDACWNEDTTTSKPLMMEKFSFLLRATCNQEHLRFVRKGFFFLIQMFLFNCSSAAARPSDLINKDCD